MGWMNGSAGNQRASRRGSGAVAVACALLLAGGLATAVLAGACGDKAKDSPVYNEADNGSTIQAAVGDTFTIRLSENASTGYTWTLRHSRGLRLLGDELEQPTTSPAIVGAPGTRVFEFEVAGAGRQLVQAVYHRTWEAKDDTGTQEFALTVDVE